MSTFMQLQNDLRELEYKIIQAGGEDTGDYEELKALVAKKAENVAGLLDNKILDMEIDRLKSIKKEIDSEIKNITGKKEWLENQLYNYIVDNGEFFFVNGVKKKVKKSMSIRNEVDSTKLKNTNGYYMVKLSPEIYLTLIDENIIEENSGKQVCNVTDLPEDHPAINKIIRPKVKFVKG